MTQEPFQALCQPMSLLAFLSSPAAQESEDGVVAQCGQLAVEAVGCCPLQGHLSYEANFAMFRHHFHVGFQWLRRLKLAQRLWLLDVLQRCLDQSARVMTPAPSWSTLVRFYQVHQSVCLASASWSPPSARSNVRKQHPIHSA